MVLLVSILCILSFASLSVGAMEPGMTEKRDIEQVNYKNVNDVVDKTTQATRLHQAVLKGDMSLLLELLHRYQAHGEVRMIHGITPLMIISAGGTYGMHHANKRMVIRDLINKKADCNAQNDEGATPLLLAARAGNVAICRYLHTLGATFKTPAESIYREARWSYRRRQRAIHLSHLPELLGTEIHPDLFVKNLHFDSFEGLQLIDENQSDRKKWTGFSLDIPLTDKDKNVINFIEREIKQLDSDMRKMNNTQLIIEFANQRLEALMLLKKPAREMKQQT